MSNENLIIKEIFKFLADHLKVNPILGHNLINQELVRTDRMKFSEYRNLDITTLPFNECLDIAETHVEIIHFLDKLILFIEELKTQIQVHSLIFQLPNMINQLLADLKSRNIQLLELSDSKDNYVKSYTQIRSFLRYSFNTRAFDLPDIFVTYFEAVIKEYIEPIAHKLTPALKSSIYLSPAKAIRILNETTNYEYQELLNIIDTDLRNAIQHKSFIYLSEENSFIYSKSYRGKSRNFQLSEAEMLDKVLYIQLLFILLNHIFNEEKSRNVVETALTSILNRTFTLFEPEYIPIWMKGEKIANSIHLRDLGFKFALHKVGVYCIFDEPAKAASAFHSVLNEYKMIQRDPLYLKTAFGFIQELYQQLKDEDLNRELKLILIAEIDKFQHKTDIELSYLAKCTFAVGLSFFRFGNLSKAQILLSRAKRLEKYLETEYISYLNQLLEKC